MVDAGGMMLGCCWWDDVGTVLVGGCCWDGTSGMLVLVGCWYWWDNTGGRVLLG